MTYAVGLCAARRTAKEFYRRATAFAPARTKALFAVGMGVERVCIMEEAKFAVPMRSIHHEFELDAGSSRRQSTFDIDGLGPLLVALT